MPDPSKSNLWGVTFALLAFALFSSHDVIVKTLGSQYAPFQIVFFSVLFGFPLATLMLMRDPTSGNLRPVHPWWTALRTGATVITASSGFYAFSTLPLAQVYAILFAAPLLITILSIPILGERVGLHRWFAVAVGLAGVLVVLRPGVEPLQPGHIAAIVAAVGAAVASVIVRNTTKTPVNPTATASQRCRPTRSPRIGIDSTVISKGAAKRIAYTCASGRVENA